MVGDGELQRWATRTKGKRDSADEANEGQYGSEQSGWWVCAILTLSGGKSAGEGGSGPLAPLASGHGGHFLSPARRRVCAGSTVVERVHTAARG